MNLCRKCRDTINDITKGWQLEWRPESWETTVCESECKFPLHKQFNALLEEAKAENPVFDWDGWLKRVLEK